VKVTDRRRFTPEGEPVEQEPEPAAEAAQGEQEGGEAADPRIAEQAARIDELTRAYAALVEDNKAFRQRLEREQARVLEAELISLAQTLLEAADDLERALGAVSSDEAAGTLAEGVRLSLGTLHQRIARLGAERITVVGAPFDPHVAEAIDTVAVADTEQDGKVLQEISPGWRIGQRILRPARVRVGRVARA
jgi:molecular chaperone GrpE